MQLPEAGQRSDQILGDRVTSQLLIKIQMSNLTELHANLMERTHDPGDISLGSVPMTDQQDLR